MALRESDGDLDDDSNYYRLARLGLLWNGEISEALPLDGGRVRRLTPRTLVSTDDVSANDGTDVVDSDEAFVYQPRLPLE